MSTASEIIVHALEQVVKDAPVGTNLALLYLPKYCPRANPLEDLWRVLKTPVQANRYWSSLPPLEEAVNEFVAGLTRDDLLHICEKRIRKNFCKAA